MQSVAERVQSEQLANVSSAFLRVRPKLLAPVGPLLLLLLHQAEIPRAQFFSLAAVFLMMLAGFSLEAWHVRRTPPTPRSLCLSLLLTLGGLGLLCGFSGGTRSPFVVLLFAPLGIALAAFGRQRPVGWVLAGFGAVLAYLTLCRALFDWPPFGEPLASILSTAALVLCAALLYFGLTGLAAGYRRTALRLGQMQSEVLAAASRHSEQLQSIGSQVAHELRNPLASIKALVQLVHDGLDEPKGSERTRPRLSVVISEVSRMDGILKDYLSFARPLGTVEAHPHALQPFLREFLQLLEGEAANQGVTTILHCPAVELSFDPAKLRQALLNLAQNALSAMPSGGELTLSVEESAERVLLCLQDTGTGMAEPILARIKEPFFSARPGGSGLGVVIANNLVSQHGGTLSFESEQGRGTRALISLPRQQPEETP